MIGLQTNASVECGHQYLCSIDRAREADMSAMMHYDLALPTWEACIVTVYRFALQSGWNCTQTTRSDTNCKISWGFL